MGENRGAFPQVEAFLGIAGFAESGPVELLGQNLLQSVAHDRVIVGQKNLHAAIPGEGTGAGGRGTPMAMA